MGEVKLNDAVTEALSELLTVDKGCVAQKPWPRPITHGYYNRRMVLEAFLFLGGTGVSQEGVAHHTTGVHGQGCDTQGE
jgi:hypothetical protein